MNAEHLDARVMFVADTPGSISQESENNTKLQLPLTVEAREKAHLDNVYCTYLVKCRFDDRISTALEFAKCIDFLREEILILQPQVVVTVGRTVSFDDAGKVHTLDFPDLIREFVDPHVAVRWTIDPVEVNQKKDAEPELLQKFYAQHAAITSLIH